MRVWLKFLWFLLWYCKYYGKENSTAMISSTNLEQKLQHKITFPPVTYWVASIWASFLRCQLSVDSQHAPDTFCGTSRPLHQPSPVLHKAQCVWGRIIPWCTLKILTTSVCCSTACDSLHTQNTGPLVSLLTACREEGTQRESYGDREKRGRRRDKGRGRNIVSPIVYAADLTQTSARLMLVRIESLWIEAFLYFQSPKKENTQKNGPTVLWG